jgi:hypothetical protein
LKFENFLEDMGERPPKTSIERMRNNHGYQPNNCVWATASQQSRNKRNNRMVTLDGRTQCVTAWCEELGLKCDTVFHRVYVGGWTYTKALKHPIKGKRL